jgi:hypothetical protein
MEAKPFRLIALPAEIRMRILRELLWQEAPLRLDSELCADFGLCIGPCKDESELEQQCKSERRNQASKFYPLLCKPQISGLKSPHPSPEVSLEAVFQTRKL